MGFYSFHKDLKESKKTETEFYHLMWGGYFSKLPLDVRKRAGNFKDYDFEVDFPKKTETFELKEDFYCKKSGNVAVEYESRGKESGIKASKAMWWVYKLHLPEKPSDTCVWVLWRKANLLKEVLKEKHPCKEGGDKGSRTKMSLIPHIPFIAAAELYFETQGKGDKLTVIGEDLNDV